MAIAATQASFVVGSVFLKSSLKYVDEERGESFSPIVYALAREASAGPILLLLSWLIAGPRCGAGVARVLWCSAEWPAAPSWHPCSEQATHSYCCAQLLCGATVLSRAAHALPFCPAGSTYPKRADLWRVLLLGLSMFLSQVRSPCSAACLAALASCRCLDSAVCCALCRRCRCRCRHRCRCRCCCVHPCTLHGLPAHRRLPPFCHQPAAAVHSGH